MKIRNPIVSPSIVNFCSTFLYNGREIEGMFLFPFIIMGDEKPSSKKKLDSWNKFVNHESIHYYQCLKYYVIGFYIMYSYDYIVGRIKGMGHYQAYRNVRFEVEAYDNDDNLDYLNSL